MPAPLDRHAHQIGIVGRNPVVDVNLAKGAEQKAKVLKLENATLARTFVTWVGFTNSFVLDSAQVLVSNDLEKQTASPKRDSTNQVACSSF